MYFDLIRKLKIVANEEEKRRATKEKKGMYAEPRARIPIRAAPMAINDILADKEEFKREKFIAIIMTLDNFLVFERKKSKFPCYDLAYGLRLSFKRTTI